MPSPARVITIDEFYANRTAFINAAAQAYRPWFRPPMPAPEIVLLVDGFQCHANTRFISDLSRHDLAELSGCAIAGPVRLLCDMAVVPCPLEYPLVIFTGPRFGVLTDNDRKLVRQAFQVPVFEQFLGLSNEVLAEECSAHSGLHVREACFEEVRGELVVTSLAPGNYVVPRLATGLIGNIVQGHCTCGDSGLRLVNLRPVLRRTAIAAR